MHRSLKRATEELRRVACNSSHFRGPDLYAPTSHMTTRACCRRWLVVYRILQDGVQIVRIVDGAQNLTELELPNE
jgi:hypothetical protein